MYHSRHKMKYCINHKLSQYQVTSKGKVGCHSLHNIYVRLLKVNLPSLQRNVKVQYQLYIKGYKMAPIYIGEMVHKHQLRLIGQYLAQNLNINYFDDSNTSEHHIIRHMNSKK